MTLIQFKQKIQKQQIYYIVLMTVLIIFFITFLFFFLNNKTNYFGSGFVTGIVVGSIAALFRYYLQNRKALQTNENLKQLYIIREDERKKVIQQSAFALSTQIMMILLMLIAIYFTFTHLLIAYIIIAITYTSFIVYGLCYIYISRQT